MKNMVIFILAVMLTLSLPGCGADKQNEQTDTSPAEVITVPTETDPPVLGTLCADLVENLPNGTYREVARAVTDEGAAEIAIFSSSALRDITISQVEMDFEGSSYIVIRELLKRDLLLSGEVIVVETYIPDVCSNIQISCTSSEGQVTRYLFQSGKDGSILLLDE